MRSLDPFWVEDDPVQHCASAGVAILDLVEESLVLTSSFMSGEAGTDARERLVA